MDRGVSGGEYGGLPHLRITSGWQSSGIATNRGNACRARFWPKMNAGAVFLVGRVQKSPKMNAGPDRRRRGGNERSECLENLIHSGSWFISM